MFVLAPHIHCRPHRSETALPDLDLTSGAPDQDSRPVLAFPALQGDVVLGVNLSRPARLDIGEVWVWSDRGAETTARLLAGWCYRYLERAHVHHSQEVR